MGGMRSRSLRIISSTLCVAVLAGCAHGQSSSAAQSAGASGAAGPVIPQYPGSQPSCGQSFTNCVAETTDSFQTVYDWYKSHLPGGSEQQLGDVMHKPAADFRVGNADVLINAPAGKTQINITDDQP
jgi:hypothetical protein